MAARKRKELPREDFPKPDPIFDEPPLIEPGGVIAWPGELEKHPTKKFRLVLDQGFGPKTAEALLVRFEGEVHAYVNVCPHVGTPLDWMPNEFFDAEGRRLMCRTHGALFDPVNGDCLTGPCQGKALRSIPVEQRRDGTVYLT